MKPTAVILAVIVAVAGLIYVGARQSRHAKVGYTEPNPTLPELPQGNLIGKPAPDFSLDDLKGAKVTLADYKGKALLVNFWATWCGPCKIEMPWFVELQNQYGPQGLVIVGIAMDDSGKDAIASFSRDMKVNYPILLGKEAVGEAYGGVLGLPTSFFVDRSGKIVAHIEGLADRSTIEDDIKLALGTSKKAAVPDDNKADGARKAVN